MRETRKPIPSVETIQKYLVYNPETGVFLRRSVDKSRNKKRKESCDNRPVQTVVQGYLVTSIERVIYKAHRLAWKLFYGEEPPLYIDHINGNTLDNRIANLRAATTVQNQWNRVKKPTLRPYKGVWFESYRGGGGAWRARITCEGTIFDIGSYRTPEEARAARLAILPLLHGEFANPG